MTPDVKRTQLQIMGMRGNRCRECVAEVLESVSGVKDVHVNLYRAGATIIHESQCSPADLIAAVIRAGYGATLAPDGSARSDSSGSRNQASPEARKETRK